MTNEPNVQTQADGFFGISPCHEGLADYSFAHQISLIEDDNCDDKDPMCKVNASKTEEVPVDYLGVRNLFWDTRESNTSTTRNSHGGLEINMNS